MSENVLKRKINQEDPSRLLRGMYVVPVELMGNITFGIVLWFWKGKKLKLRRRSWVLLNVSVHFES